MDSLMEKLRSGTTDNKARRRSDRSRRKRTMSARSSDLSLQAQWMLKSIQGDNSTILRRNSLVTFADTEAKDVKELDISLNTISSYTDSPVSARSVTAIPLPTSRVRHQRPLEPVLTVFTHVPSTKNDQTSHIRHIISTAYEAPDNR